MLRDLAFQKPGGVHLKVVLEALFRVPALRLFAMAGGQQVTEQI